MSIALLFPPGYKPVIKHGDHDQSSHGNWATGNFDEDNEREAAQNTYFDRYGFDKDGKPTGITVDEIDSVVFYIGEGYTNINSFARGKGDTGSRPLTEIEDLVFNLDKVIDEAPEIFGDKTLFRVFSEKVLSNLNEGDVITDKGFLSTTRVDITKSENLETLESLQMIRDTPDRVAVILPSPSGKGKGLSIDMFSNAVSGVKGTASFNSGQADTEKEVLLPRGTSLKFLGYKTDVGNEAQIAVFQRMDK